jgi:hypothetical protein
MYAISVPKPLAPYLHWISIMKLFRSFLLSFLVVLQLGWQTDAMANETIFCDVFAESAVREACQKSTLSPANKYYCHQKFSAFNVQYITDCFQSRLSDVDFDECKHLHPKNNLGDKLNLSRCLSQGPPRGWWPF